MRTTDALGHQDAVLRRAPEQEGPLPMARTCRSLALMTLIVMAAGCSSAADPTHPSRPSDTASASTAATAGGGVNGMHGIIVLDCKTDTVTVTSYDPATGQPGETRTFSQAGADSSPCPVTGTATITERSRRNAFNADYTKLAATQTGSDGGTHVGFIDVSGTFTDLTPAKATGFSAKPPAQKSPVFNPGTGRLWFYDANTPSTIGSVDPTAGPGSSRAEPAGSLIPDGETRFDFSADGTTVVQHDTYGTVTPNGKLGIYYDPAAGWKLNNPKKVNNPTTTEKPLSLPTSAPAQYCSAPQFIDASTFLCVGQGVASEPNGVYTLTLNAAHTGLSEVALLPETPNSILDAVAAPDGQHIAFISTDAGTRVMSLYVTGRGSRTEPRKIADLSGDTPSVAGEYSLSSWS